jgi:hypothetical protein
MKVEIEPEYFVDPIDAVGQVLNEAIIYFEPDGVKLFGIDDSNVAGAFFSVKKEKFKIYEVENTITIGTKLPDFIKLLKKAKKENIKISNHMNEFRIRFGDKEFTLPNLELESEQKPFPNLQPSCLIRLSPEQVKEALEDVSTVMENKDKDVSVHLSCEGTPDLIFKSENLPKTAKSPQHGELVRFEKKEYSSYSHNYFSETITNKITEIIEISFQKDYPLSIVYPTDKYELKFLVAPRVENE